MEKKNTQKRYYGVDIVASWNFKHIVRYEKIVKFNAVNLELGYHQIAIHSPREIATYGKDKLYEETKKMSREVLSRYYKVNGGKALLRLRRMGKTPHSSAV
jgi:hypothetical protein